AGPADPADVPPRPAPRRRARQLPCGARQPRGPGRQADRAIERSIGDVPGQGRVRQPGDRPGERAGPDVGRDREYRFAAAAGTSRIAGDRRSDRGETGSMKRMTLVDNLSASDRPVGLRMRADLVMSAQRHGGERFWAVKDPLTLQYFHLRD